MVTSNTLLANYIRNLRRNHSVSQASLGDAIGLTQPQVSLLERGGCQLAVTARHVDEIIQLNLMEHRTPGGAFRVGRLH
jgi:transcriptional regulator with XRE-family HTH domain